MLVHPKESDQLNLPVGIAVSEWKLDGKKRTFILYPISYLIGYGSDGRTVERQFVEIGCVTEEDGDLEIIAPATDEWKAIGNGFGDDSHGYLFDEQTRGDLYVVWDDGAGSKMQAAKRLFKVFSPLIKYYDDAAWKYLGETFEPILKDARSKGWETDSLHNYPLDFPYEIEQSAAGGYVFG